MSEMNYNEISKIWVSEVNEESLQPFTRRQLLNIIVYISKVRLTLASDGTSSKLQEDLLKQEALNLEFMLKDLLLIRKQKILNLVLTNRHPPVKLTILDEEDFYKKVKTAFDIHQEFVESSLSGSSTSTKSDETESEDASPEDEYMTVRFLKAVDNAFLGLDGHEHGPFKKEDVAMIPVDNARNWERNGTVSRVILEDEVAGSGE